MHLFSRHATREIAVEDLDEALRNESVRVLDVREDWEFRRGRVPGAVSVPLGQLSVRLAELPQDKPYAVICESGSRSRSAADFLLGRGFVGAASVRGGTSAWARAGRPIEND